MIARLLALLLLLAAPAAAEPARNIVSLGGSVTEIAVALGAGDRLVARDTTSNFPPSVRELPDVGYIRALSPEGMLALAPDLILSEAGAGPPEAIEVLKAAGIPFVQMPGDPSPHGVLDKIDAVAAALDLPEAGARLHAEVAQGLAEAEARAAAIPARKRVMFIIAIQSGRVNAGGEGSSAEGIIRLAGAENAVRGFQGYKQMTDEAIIEADPEVILMMNREGPLEVQNRDILDHPALSQTRAVRDGAILRMDGMKILGFGPRTPEAARELHDALYGG